MEVSISEASKPRCPCRVGKEVSPVIPRDHRHHEPHPWTAATATASLVVLRRRHARTARKAWDWNEGKPGETFWKMLLVGLLFWGDDMMDKQVRGVCKVEIVMEKMSRHRL